MKPKILVFTGYGINCEEETKYAFDASGGNAQIMHINDVIEKKNKIKDYQILAFPGGFAYGDDTGSGNAYANKLKNHIWAELIDFINDKKLILGICNGFQILVNLGLLPAIKMKYGNRELGLTPNKFPRYTVRFVDLRIDNPKSVWLKNIQNLSIPVSNGEGRLYASKDVLKKMQDKKLVAARYVKGEMCKYLDLPASPNGSMDNIASVTDETGRILGIMPHPERAMFFTQLPNWPLLKEKLVRNGKELPTKGPGQQIFDNSIRYFL